MEHASLIAALSIAFVAGLASFLLPCVLPLVPVYLASLAGSEVLEAKIGRRRLPIFFHSLSFVGGFSVVFSLWGAGMGLIGSVLLTYAAVVREIAGGLMIAFGLFMMAALKVPWLNYERRLSVPLGGTTGFLRSFLTGGVFCLAWTPCVGPVLGGILTLAGSSGTVWRGTYLLAVYSLGLGLPFLAAGAAFDFITPLLRSVNRYSVWIHLVSGVLLIAVGVLILTNRLAWLYAIQK